MKINKIYISAFGGLKDFTLDLNSGLNVIYGNNEDGKSTVAAFIKAMFYGTGKNNKKELSENIRQKYTPWSGNTMAGRIFFENEGKSYCLEREFRKSDSTDRIMLTDLNSGKQISTSENIGQQFFGVSAATFERSLFIGNGDFIKDDTAAGEINGKLSNIAVTGSEDVSYKKIEKNILDARNKLVSKSGKAGSYNEDLQRLKQLEQRLENADRDAKLKQRLHDQATLKLCEHEQLNKTQKELKAKLDLKQDFENKEKLTEFLNTKAKLDAVNGSLTLTDGTVINEAFTQKIEFGINKYQKSADRCEQIDADIKQIKATIELQSKTSPENAKQQIEALTNEVNSLNNQKNSYIALQAEGEKKVNILKQELINAQNKKTAVNPIFLILAAVLASVGVGLTFVSVDISIALYAVAAVLITLSFIIRPQDKKASTTAQSKLTSANNELSDAVANKNRIQEQINNINAQINMLSSALNADAAVKSQYFASLNEKENILNDEKQKQAAALSELLPLVNGFNTDGDIEKIKALCEQLRLKTQEQKELKLQLKTASQYLGNIDYAMAKEKLDTINKDNTFDGIDFDAVAAEYQDVSDKLSGIKDQITAIATELKTSFRKSENPEEIKREILELQEKITAKKEFCDCADIALEALSESFYELRRGYGSELEKLTHSIFSDLTDGKYKSVTVSDSLDLAVEQSDVFGTREIGFLSLGTTHQAYLSLRLAIAKLISGGNSLPIFLDDALSQYDDIRTEKAIKYLNNFCKDSQGVLFTCHSSICEAAKKQNINILKPYGAEQ